MTKLIIFDAVGVLYKLDGKYFYSKLLSFLKAHNVDNIEEEHKIWTGLEKRRQLVKYHYAKHACNF